MSSKISIHALLAESDSGAKTILAKVSDFYPRSPCGERHGAELDIHHNFPISIHALLAESDMQATAQRLPPQAFLSTLSLRRATLLLIVRERAHVISIHALLAESDRQYKMLKIECNISIHALLAESDQRGFQSISKLTQFLSTLSLRRATAGTIRTRAATTDFYPRSPCGERPTNAETAAKAAQFLSTLSLRRATLIFCRYNRRLHYFYPRSPCGERRQNRHQRKRKDISIHALLAESDV